MTFQDRIDRWLDYKAGGGDYADLFTKSGMGDFFAAYRVSAQDLAALKGLSKAGKVNRMILHMGIDESNKLSPFLQYGDSVEGDAMLLELDTQEGLPTLPGTAPGKTSNHLHITQKQADEMIKGLWGKDLNKAVLTKKSKELVRKYSFRADLNDQELLGELPISSRVHFWFGIYSAEELSNPPSGVGQVADFPVLNALLTLFHEVKEGTDDCSYDYSVPCPPTC